LALQLSIDHAVIAVRDLDAAAASFTALGFTLTPRGFHSIGSENHCIMLGSTYIELLAAPVAHPWLEHYRAFLGRQGDGLAAIALSTGDADRAYADLKDRGARAPMDLSRPVEGGVARFRLVQIQDTLFVCQHLTRDLVWRPQWQTHANGATELVGIAWREQRPFGGLPDSIEWNTAPALRLGGLRKPLQAHGVRLAPA
jgi:hypothetical protein